MLEDTARTAAFSRAIEENPDKFYGKVVLELGCGTSLLSMVAAQAGAARVYALEAAENAKHAELVVGKNGLGDVVTVISGTIEKVELPEQVDIIVSEWTRGYLLRKSTIESLIYARDKFLKSGGALYPSKCRLYLAPASHTGDEVKMKGPTFEQKVQDWGEFVDDTKKDYGLDFSCLSETYMEEAREAYLGVSRDVSIATSEVLAPPVCVKEIDMLTATVGECSRIDACSFATRFYPSGSGLGGSARSPNGGRHLTMFVGWHSVHFEGSPANPATIKSMWSTGPGGATTELGPRRTEEEELVVEELAEQERRESNEEEREEGGEERPWGRLGRQASWLVYPPLPLSGAGDQALRFSFAMPGPMATPRRKSGEGSESRLYNITLVYSVGPVATAEESTQHFSLRYQG